MEPTISEFYVNFDEMKRGISKLIKDHQEENQRKKTLLAEPTESVYEKFSKKEEEKNQ